MGTTNSDKFFLLMWKNFRIQWHRKREILFETLLPTIFVLLLVLVRLMVDPEEVTEPTLYNPVAIDNLNFLRAARYKTTNISRYVRKLRKTSAENHENWELIYAPKNEYLDEIVKDAAAMLKLSYKSANDEKSLERYMMTENAIAGIQFESTAADLQTWPENLKYALRFPSELRFGSLQILETWVTNHLFPSLQFPGPRNIQANAGGTPPAYIEEGFIAIQHAIAKAYLMRAGKTVPIVPDVKLQRYPYPPFTNDMFLQGLESFIPLIILLSFVTPCKYIVKCVSEEKELQLKEVMKIMGLPNWLHWTSWFLKSFIMIFLSSVLMIVLMKIRWSSEYNVAVLTYCHWSTLLFFLSCYAISCITFCFALSTFFNKSSTAAAVSGLLMYLSFMPYQLTLRQYSSLSLAQKMFMGLFSGSAMSFGFKVIIQHEGTGEGLHWNNMFKQVNVDDNLHVGHMVIMLLVSSVLHMLIALYTEQVMPGEFGIPQKWYFPFTKEFWCSYNTYSGIEDLQQAPKLDGDSFEREPIGKNAGIQIRRLRKVFGKKVAVNSLTMNLYEDEVTVLLGHNGAGKTTTISMLTGMITPTSGTATINGSDIRADMKGARTSIGLCPQHNILFQDLTVREHITFYSRLKGLKQDQINAEIQKYVTMLELQDKIDVQAQQLSGGMKRKLSVGVALCGHSKVVLLDEPSSGMDPSARRSLWELIQKEKKGRTILLTTHYMDEADVLGDRIGILSDSDLKCFGSSFFLKKKFGVGYRLICVKGLECHSTDITDLLKRYIPNIEIDSEIGNELSYTLPEQYAPIFEDMLSKLEDSSEQLGLNGYGISNTTLEEVFLTVGTEKVEKTKTDPNEHIYHLPIDSDGNITESAHMLRSSNIILNQWRAMILKKFLHSLRNIVILLVQIIIPIFFICLTVVIYNSLGNLDLNPLKINLNLYAKTVSILETKSVRPNSMEMRIANEYKKMFEPADSRNELIHITEDFQNYILDLYRTILVWINSRYMVSATISKDGIIGWFNNQAFHNAPLTLNLIHNAMVRVIVGPKSSIEVVNNPLPFTAETRIKQLNSGNNIGFQFSINLSFCMSFVTAFYIMFIIKERESRAKLLQFVSGAKVFVFWLSHFAWDYLTFLIVVTFTIITFACFKEDSWTTPAELGRITFVFLMFGFSVLPFTYLVSFICSNPVLGFSRLFIFNMFAGMGMFLTIFVMSLEVFDLKTIANSLTWIFMACPHFSLAQSLNKLSTLSSYIKLCDTTCETVMSNKCNKEVLCVFFPQCCHKNYFSWEDPGIGKNVTYMLATGLIFFAILLLIEFKIIHEIIYTLKKIWVEYPSQSNEQVIEQDVTLEKDRVRKMSAMEIESYNLILDRVTKYYGSFVAVNQISVAIRHSECFGLLGVNGAGKTSTFKMLIGDEEISVGNVYLKGINLKNDIGSAFCEMGYCPQFDALIEDLTARETLRIFCLLRGLPENMIDAISKDLAKSLGFAEHYHKRIKFLSGGNKRKVSTALALVGHPSVIYLDEPTTGMDPGARRKLWNAICNIRDAGKTIVLTSHSMEECEALCTRLAIMVNGEFMCMGSTQHLKNLYSKGLILKIKMKRRNHVGEYENANPKEGMQMHSLSQTLLQEDVEKIMNLIQSKFPSTILKEQYQSILTFYIPLKTIKWSAIFGFMETNKMVYNVEDYSLTQTTLEEVFLEFAKHQKDERPKHKKCLRRCCDLCFFC